MAFVPNPVTHSSSRLLEFETLRELLGGYASSALGQRRIAELLPSLDRPWIENQQQLTTEIREYRRVGGRFEFAGLPEVRTLIEKSRISGAALETGEIRDVVLIADRAAEWREIVRQPPAAMRSEWVAVSALSNGIQDFTAFLRTSATRSCPTGRSMTTPSPELAASAARSKSSARTIQDSLRGYLRRSAEGGTVQDELITIRGERFVIPVKVEQKRRVQGVVHGASSSGQTVFVEPLETIEQNNELVRLLEEEQAEIHRILLEMTRRIGEQCRGDPRRRRCPRRTGTAIRQSPLRRGLQLRRVKLSGRSGRTRKIRVGTGAPAVQRRSGPHPPAVGRMSGEPKPSCLSSTTPAIRCWNAT